MAACLRCLCENREKMHEVGANAQRDIYISWDQAVKGAVERYGEVIENYKAGVYPKHETPRDELFSGIGDLMNLLGTGEARRDAIRDTLSDVLAGRAPRAEWLHPFDASVTNAVFQGMRSSLEGWKTGVTDWTRSVEAGGRAGLAEWKAGMEQGREKARQRRAEMEEALESFYDIFL
jgi:hypothetical protein